jgi:hypothetical protein
MWGRHLHAPEAVTGGPPSNPFPDRGCPLNGPQQDALGAASAVGDVALGFDERALPGAVRQSTNGSCLGGASSGTVDPRCGLQGSAASLPA